MCLRKLFPEWFEEEVEPIPEPVGKKKTALLFAINNYPGTGNDLNGCLNDLVDMKAMLQDKFSGFTIKEFRDSQVTGSTFTTEISKAISLLNSGDFLLVHYSGHGTQVSDSHNDESDYYDEAVYLYDGVVTDDSINYALRNIPDGATVLLMFDSCFSGTVTRAFGCSDIRNRFMPLPNQPIKKTLNKPLAKGIDMNWIVFSGCQENQTSADAYINGRYNGAFTAFALKALRVGMTYNEWMLAIQNYLPSSQFDQAPTIEGKTILFNKLIFE